MKAYSIDLRQKIIETYENERISQRQLARRCRVTPSFIVKLLKQYRETGKLAPTTSPGRPRELDEAQMQRVQALVEANPDLTLDELRAEVAQQCGVMVGRPTMCRVMKRLQWIVQVRLGERQKWRQPLTGNVMPSSTVRCKIAES